MNIISYEKAYCLYPRATLHEHTSLVCESSTSRTRHRPEALQKYESRGFRLLEYIEPDETGMDPCFSVFHRYMGDSLCWTLPLNMEGVTPGFTIPTTNITLSHDPCSVTSWVLAVRDPESSKPEIVFKLRSHRSLYFMYPVVAATLVRYLEELPYVRPRPWLEDEGPFARPTRFL